MKKNEYGFVEDPRYEQCNKEALYGVGLGVINLIIWFVFGYGLGSKPVESYTYILGFPSWFFFSCILNAIFIILMTFFVVDKKMKDMPLERMSYEQAEEYFKKITVENVQKEVFFNGKKISSNVSAEFSKVLGKEKSDVESDKISVKENEVVEVDKKLEKENGGAK